MANIDRYADETDFARDLAMSDVDDKQIDWGRLQKIRHNLNKDKSFGELYNICLNLKLNKDRINSINKAFEKVKYDEDLAGYFGFAAEWLLDEIYTDDDSFVDTELDYLVEAIYEYKDGNVETTQRILDNLFDRIEEFEDDKQ